ncbi:kazal-type serine protease inhibitor domain-containing protein 1-like [Pelobates fuscus]|uniref:kazal-type serine protease inhibitor domain-containing protein 1-like n=1 Tax=Pelobates fuscus TaxID=191477 RepID=UPI002FE46B36
MLYTVLLGSLLLACSDLVYPRHLPLEGWNNKQTDLQACSRCQQEKCPPMSHRCPGGKVKDRCDCCWECANVEGQMCDLPRSRHQYGACGEGLQCQMKSGQNTEGQCVCLTQESVCGTDRRTYKNSCRLREAANTKWRKDLRINHTGPCREAPVVLSGPQDTLVLAGQSVILGCEVTAQPLAELEWKKEGTEGALPGHNSHMVVQTHGGPQRHLVTGWLQIHWVRASDAGLYTCKAWNQLGNISASATLTVIPSDSLRNEEVPAYRVGIFDLSDDEDDYGKYREGPSGSYE